METTGMSSLAERFGSKRDKSHKERDKDHRLSKADIGGPISTSEKSDGTESSKGPVMVLRCVIVHKDENGYGLTVSGDNPVYVQSVKEDGAAYKAGVRQGDRIVNVNGTRVTECNHIEVVKLIKSGVFVNLTLLGESIAGAARTQTTDLTNPGTATNKMAMPNVSQPTPKGDNTFFNEKVATIKKMLTQEAAEVERIKEDYAKQPNSRLLNQLGIAQKLKTDLEKQLWKAEKIQQSQMNMVQVPAGPQDISSSDVEDRNSNTGDLEGIELFGDEETPNLNEKRNLSPDAREQDSHSNMHGPNDGKDNPIIVTSPNNDENLTQNTEIMNFEDDDIANDTDTFCDHGPFGDFEKLRSRQAHMSVFIKYVFTHHEPNHLLLVLAVDSFRGLTSNKTSILKTADNICKTYLVPNAILKVNVDDGIAKSIVDTVHNGKNLSEETLKTVFELAVQHCRNTVKNQLSNFCTKREKGLGSLFGEEKLQYLPDHSMEVKVAEEVISNLIQDLSTTANNPDSPEVAKIEALQHYLAQMGVKRRSKISKIGSMLRPSRNPPQMTKNRISGSMESIVDEPKRQSMIFMPKTKKRDKNRGAITGPERMRSFIDRRDSRRVKARSATTIESGSQANGDFVNRIPYKPSKLADGSPNSSRRHTTSGAANSRHNSSAESHPPSVHYGKLQSSELSTIVASPFIVRRKTAAHRTTAAQLITSSVIPVIQSTPQLVNPDGSDGSGNVTQLVNKFDGTDSASNLSENYEFNNNKGSTRHKRSGSFHKNDDKRTRPGNGKSNSDPDVNKVNDAISQHSTSVSDVSDLTNSSSTSTLSEDQLPYNSNDPELDIEPESNWSATTPAKFIKGVDKKEIKRQEIIFELFHTERHHVRDLKILELLFYQRMMQDGLLTQEELNCVFPNLIVVLDMHRQLNKKFQGLKEKHGYVIQDIGDVLLSRFDDTEGKKFKEECARYCGNQSVALNFIKERCKKDQKFAQFIQNTERYPICRRLQLKDYVPMEFQRLTKYPLLLDNIIKNTKKKEEKELAKLRKVSAQCKDILSFVNKTVKDAEDRQKIVEIHNNLDTSPLQKFNHPEILNYRNINFLERKLVHQGPLVWRLNQGDKKKSFEMHCVVFEDIIVLLQRQDEKYLLKCHTATGVAAISSRGEDKSIVVHPPVLKLAKVFVRNVATDKRAFFLMCSTEFGPQMYELVTKTHNQMQEWLKIIAEAADAAKRKDVPVLNNQRRAGIIVPESSRPEKSKIKITKAAEILKTGDVPDTADVDEPENVQTLPEMLSTSVQIEEEDTLKKIEYKHQEIVAAIAFKHKLLAEVAGLADNDLDKVLDMALTDPDPDPNTLVVHSLLHADKLTQILNDLMQPDTVFLQTSQPMLMPSDKEPLSTSSSNTTTPAHTASEQANTSKDDYLKSEQNSEIKDDNAETDQEGWVEPVGGLTDQEHQNEENINDAYKITDGSKSNVSGEIVLSDYETASESASPEDDSHAGDSENLNTDNQDEIPEDTVSILQTDTGISSEQLDTDDAASDNTLSAVEQVATEQNETENSSLIDLLSFDDGITPTDMQGLVSPIATSSEQLMVKTEPVQLGKMLSITFNLQAQLTQLLQAVKQSEASRQQLIEENERLSVSLARFERQDNNTTIDSQQTLDNSETNTTTDDVPLNSDNADEFREDPPPTYASVVVADSCDSLTEVNTTTTNEIYVNIASRKKVNEGKTRVRSFSDISTISNSRSRLNSPKSTGF